MPSNILDMVKGLQEPIELPSGDGSMLSPGQGYVRFLYVRIAFSFVLRL